MFPSSNLSERNRSSKRTASHRQSRDGWGTKIHLITVFSSNAHNLCKIVAQRLRRVFSLPIQENDSREYGAILESRFCPICILDGEPNFKNRGKC